MKKGTEVELSIEALAAEGKALAKVDGKVIFVPFAMPGDRVKARILRSKKQFAEAQLLEIIEPSADRIEAKCRHFGHCGGCKWQHVPYTIQLEAKQAHVQDQLERIGGLHLPEPLPVCGAPSQWFYRNKLDFSFSQFRWLTSEEIASGQEFETRNACGFHVPGRFDKVLELEECFLMDPKADVYRNGIASLARAKGLDFYHPYQHTGLMRNLVLRNNRNGDWMVWVVFSDQDHAASLDLMAEINQTFPEIHSLLYSFNPKKNDALHDLEVKTFAGASFLTETLGETRFKIAPQSFFQTNPEQTLVLYNRVKELADLKGNEIVYDLYCGTGTIGCFVADQAKFVLGLEYVPEAVDNAFENASLNGFANMHFLAGDLKDLLTNSLSETYGMPDVVITDPPRSGMHPAVIAQLLKLAPKRIVYVSCNPATQARDLALLAEKYRVSAWQTVDLFPHTHHVENIAVLEWM